MSRFDPAAPFADFLRKRGTTIPISQSRDFDNINVEAGITVDPTAANRMAREAAGHFRKAGDIFGNPSHELRQALGSLLMLATKHERYQPDTGPTHDLLAAVYEGLGGAISALRNDVSIADLEAGMFAAARLVQDIDAGALEGDRQSDDRCKARILVIQLRAAEYREEIEARRMKRDRQAHQTKKPATTQTAFFG
ncbi:hypothetical protein [Shinella zoogloeoides]